MITDERSRPGFSTSWAAGARIFLLALVLLAFARVTWRLGDRHLWWDESLSLQRAESSWGTLLRGDLPIRDGVVSVMSVDQHPFFSFLLQGVLLRLAGMDEFVLRFPAAAAATLLVPAVWALGRRLSSQRKGERGALPPSTAWWAASLAAVNPFFLRYGQEARPYALLATLGVVSAYCLVRALPLPSPPHPSTGSGTGEGAAVGESVNRVINQQNPPDNGPSPQRGEAGRGSFSTYPQVGDDQAEPLPSPSQHGEGAVGGDFVNRVTDRQNLPNNGPSPQRGEVGRGFWPLAYLLTLAAFLATHYYAVLLLPAHALLIGTRLMDGRATRRSRRATLVALAGVLGLGALVGGWAASSILARGGGGNFFSTPPTTILRDILNALSLGPRADVGNPWLWALDLLFAAVAMGGVAWALRRRQFIARGGWLPLAMVAIPVSAILAVGLVQPGYMNARHLAVIGGGWLLGLGAGLGALWGWRQPGARIAAVALAMLLVGGSVYGDLRLHATTFARGEARAACVGCTVDNDDFSALAEYLRQRLLPGDLVLLDPPFAWRLFDYYLPLELVNDADIFGVPLLDFPRGNADWSDTRALVLSQKRTHPRIWRIESDTYPIMDPNGHMQEMLRDELFVVAERQFDSDSALRAELYLAEAPVYNEPVDVAARGGQSVDIVFGDPESSGLRLLGYQVGAPLTSSSALPVTLYWQKITPSGEPDETRLKYILRLEEMRADGSDGGAARLLADAEREPYESAPSISMNLWAPGQTIIEYGALSPEDSDIDWEAVDWSQTRLTLRVYDPASLAGLPVAKVEGAGAEAVGDGVSLPVREDDIH